MHLKQEYFNDKRRLPVTEKKRELTKEEKKIRKITYYGIGTGIFLAILMLLVAYYIFFISYSKESASNFLGCFLVIIVIIFTTLIAALSSSKKSLKMIFLLFFQLLTCITDFSLSHKYFLWDSVSNLLILQI